MAHKHELYDTDGYFIVDADTRLISVDGGGKPTVVQKDHNSERFTFEIPRYIDEHDMSLCNRAEIHYINVGNGRKFSGLYEIEDLQVDPEDENLVLCTWLVSQNATQVVGTLNFVLHLACTTDDTIDYSWHTAIYTGVQVLETIDNTGQTVEQYPDILEQWRVSLVEAGILAADMAAARTAEQIAATMERFHGSVTLPASGWTEGKQTVVIDGMKQDSAIVFTPASLEDRAAASEASLFVKPVEGEAPDEYYLYVDGVYKYTLSHPNEGYGRDFDISGLIKVYRDFTLGIVAAKNGYGQSLMTTCKIGEGGAEINLDDVEVNGYVKGVMVVRNSGRNIVSLDRDGVQPGDMCFVGDTLFVATLVESKVIDSEGEYVSHVLTMPVGTTFVAEDGAEYTVVIRETSEEDDMGYTTTHIQPYYAPTRDLSSDPPSTFVAQYCRAEPVSKRLDDVAIYYPYQENTIRITGGCTKTKVEFSAKTIPTKDITLDYVMTDIKMNEVTT